MIMTESVIN